MEFYSKDFQCPDSGWGVYLIFDEDKEQVTASICDTGIWEMDECTEEIENDTITWCKRFGIKRCETFENAQEIAEKYDTWF